MNATNDPATEILSLPSQYDRTKAPTLRKYRRLTVAEILALSGHSEFITNANTVARCKINGKVRTWKRDANRVEVSVKYGMYEYATFQLSEALRRFVVEV